MTSACTLVLSNSNNPRYTNMKKFAFILALAAVGSASAAITLPASKAEWKSAVAAKKAENDAKKEAAKKALTDAIDARKTEAGSKSSAAAKAVTDKVAEAQAKVDAAKKTAADAKVSLEALKNAPASTPSVELEKPSIEATEAGLIIKKPSLKIK